MNDFTSPSFAPSDDMRFHKLLELTGSCSIYLDPTNQQAQIAMRPANLSSSPDSNAILTVSKFLPARWNQLTFTVEGRTVDVYLNGLLTTSTLLPDVPYSVPSQVTLFPMVGFSGQLGYIQLWPRRLTLPEIISNYKSTSDPRGKPRIPTPGTSLADIYTIFSNGFCKLGFCIDPENKNPFQYIDYTYA
jgi:hypothetical protein